MPLEPGLLNGVRFGSSFVMIYSSRHVEALGSPTIAWRIVHQLVTHLNSAFINIIPNRSLAIGQFAKFSSKSRTTAKPVSDPSSPVRRVSRHYTSSNICISSFSTSLNVVISFCEHTTHEFAVMQDYRTPIQLKSNALYHRFIWPLYYLLLAA